MATPHDEDEPMPTPHSIPRTGDEGGFALLAVLRVIVAMTGFLALTQLTSRTELRIGANTYAGTQAYYAAEAGVEKLLAEAKAQMVDGYLTTAKVDAMSS